MTGSERQRLARCRLLAELRHRQLPRTAGWSHCGAQFGTEPTALALLALHSSPSGSTVAREELEPLLACRRPNGLWPAVGVGEAGVSFWATALAVNTLMTLGSTPETFGASLDALVHCRPLEASWLVRLKLRLSDRQVRFDPKKYGWPWIPNTVSWVVPTSMALITLSRAKRQGLIRGSEFEQRLRLGAEMLLNRACPAGGWNAGNAVVYGVPLRPHIDATALAFDALLERQRRAPLPVLYGEKPGTAPPGKQILKAGVSEVIDQGKEVVVLFSLVNVQNHAVELMPPQVQLGGKVKKGTIVRHTVWSNSEQLPVEDFRMSQRRIGPGERADGVLIFQRPSFKQSNETLLLQVADSGAVDRPALAPIGFGISSLREKGAE